jgi:hypothetical protein
LPSAIELIVSGYVTTKDRRALEDLRSHRRKLLADLEAITGIDTAKSIEAVREDIAVIEAGLEELEPPPGTVPENEWG